MDPTAMLQKVEAAITALLESNAASYSIGGRTVTRNDIGKLFEERRMLLAEVQRSSGGSFTLAKFGRKR